MAKTVTGSGCVWLFLAINATQHLPRYISNYVIFISLVFMITIPAVLLSVFRYLEVWKVRILNPIIDDYTLFNLRLSTGVQKISSAD